MLLSLEKQHGSLMFYLHIYYLGVANKDITCNNNGITVKSRHLTTQSLIIYCKYSDQTIEIIYGT